MIDFPDINGLQWVSDKYPDLVIIKITLENRLQAELDIPGFKPDETIVNNYLDLSGLAGIRPWYEKGSDLPSKNECIADFVGVTQMVLNISVKELLKAWIFYKNFKYEKI